MRTTLATVILLALASSAAMAQSLRVCPNQRLTCKLEDITNFHIRKTLDQSDAGFSGLNEDEPSIPPAFCTVSSYLSNGKGLLYSVKIQDNDYSASIFMTKTGQGGLAGADVDFVVTAGTKFYYRNNSENEMLTCELSVATSTSQVPAQQAKKPMSEAEYYQCISDGLASFNSSIWPNVSRAEIESSLKQDGENGFIAMSLSVQKCKQERRERAK
jgi:hypothetical protein